MYDFWKEYQRKSLRLKEYDYSQPWYYFITICVNTWLCILGEISGNEIYLSDAGKMVETYWKKLEEKYHHIRLHKYTVMPNHFHGIIEIMDIQDGRGQPMCWPWYWTVNWLDKNQIGTYSGQTHSSAPTIGEMIQWFKTMTTNIYIQNVKNYHWEPFYKKLWQRNYYEHIIRNENGYFKISEYITHNPNNWKHDRFYITQL